MGKVTNIGDRMGTWFRSRVNPGWKARKHKERPPLHDLTLHLCPECKRPLAESNATEVLKKCDRCEVWVHLKKY
jgi:ribosomal protein L37AE/L43A